MDVLRNTHTKTKAAFTLIELLVVIAIIALLASIVLVALNGARVSARMATRIGNLRQVQTALELYYNDNGNYPIANSNNHIGALPDYVSSQCIGSSNAAANPNAVIPELVSGGYLASVPTDPQLNTSQNQNCIDYITTPNGSDYKFVDFNITDVTAQQVVTNYAAFADPQYNAYSGYTPSGCNLQGFFYISAVSVYSPGLRCFE